MVVFFVPCYFLQVAPGRFPPSLLQTFDNLQPSISHPNRSGCVKLSGAVRLHLLSVQDLGVRT